MLFPLRQLVRIDTRHFEYEINLIAGFGGVSAQNIVIDEVLGFMVTMFLVNPVGYKETIVAVILGFLLFRFFDITKIGPIDKSQHYGYGLGVVLDDFLAGVVANFLLIMFNLSA